MWWDKKPHTVPTQNPRPAGVVPAKPKLESEAPLRVSASPASHQNQTFLGRSVVLQGELSGKEDLLIEGQFDGNINLQEHCLTIGPQGQVKAEIRARQVVVHGTVNGNISAREKIDIRKTGHVVGDLLAGAIAIEEGAYFKGSIDILREQPQEVGRAVSAPGALGPGA